MSIFVCNEILFSMIGVYSSFLVLMLSVKAGAAAADLLGLFSFYPKRF